MNPIFQLQIKLSDLQLASVRQGRRRRSQRNEWVKSEKLPTRTPVAPCFTTAENERGVKRTVHPIRRVGLLCSKTNRRHINNKWRGQKKNHHGSFCVGSSFRLWPPLQRRASRIVNHDAVFRGNARRRMPSTYFHGTAAKTNLIIKSAISDREYRHSARL